MSPLGHQVFGQPNHEVFLGRDYGNTQDYSEETARRIDDEVARIMREAHDTAYEILSTRPEQMHLMARVLLERETVDGEACEALLNNRWDEYLAHEGEIIARKEAEEAAARARDEKLADPNWREKEQAAAQITAEQAAQTQQMQQMQQMQPNLPTQPIPPAAYGQQQAPYQQQVPYEQQAQMPVAAPAQGQDAAPVAPVQTPSEIGRFDPGYVNQAPAKHIPNAGDADNQHSNEQR